MVQDISNYWQIQIIFLHLRNLSVGNAYDLKVYSYITSFIQICLVEVINL